MSTNNSNSNNNIKTLDECIEYIEIVKKDNQEEASRLYSMVGPCKGFMRARQNEATCEAIQYYLKKLQSLEGDNE